MPPYQQRGVNRFVYMFLVLKGIPSKVETAKGLAKNLPFLAHHRRTSPSVQIFPGLPKRKLSRQKVYDVVFIIDDSGSIPLDQFNEGLRALRILIQKSSLGTKFAAIKYSTLAKLFFKFVSPYQAKMKLTNVAHNNGLTNTQAALKMAREDLFLNPAASGHRPLAGRVAVLVTDGNSNVQKHQTVHQATLLKGIGTKVFVIAVGNYGTSGLQEMKSIASYPYSDHWFRVEDFTAFRQVAQRIPS